MYGAIAELISSSSSLPCTVKVKGLVRSRLKIPMIDFAFTIYLPEERSISDLKCAIVFANAFTSAMESREIIKLVIHV